MSTGEMQEHARQFIKEWIAVGADEDSRQSLLESFIEFDLAVIEIILDWLSKLQSDAG